jgi:hypothetical protein
MNTWVGSAGVSFFFSHNRSVRYSQRPERLSKKKIGS